MRRCLCFKIVLHCSLSEKARSNLTEIRKMRRGPRGNKPRPCNEVKRLGVQSDARRAERPEAETARALRQKPRQACFCKNYLGAKRAGGRERNEKNLQAGAGSAPASRPRLEARRKSLRDWSRGKTQVFFYSKYSISLFTRYIAVPSL